MDYLVDTSVLLRLFDRKDQHHENIRDSLRKLRGDGKTLCVVAQNIAEFWNVSTRPVSARGGYGQPVDATARRVQFIERFGHILSESETSYLRWRSLLTDNQIIGVAVHDARLVSVMLEHSVPRILTLNAGDFKRYSDVAAVTPEAVLA